MSLIVSNPDDVGTYGGITVAMNPGYADVINAFYRATGRYPTTSELNAAVPRYAALQMDAFESEMRQQYGQGGLMPGGGMANLSLGGVLTTLGGAIGGPLGAAAGGIISSIFPGGHPSAPSAPSLPVPAGIPGAIAGGILGGLGTTIGQYLPGMTPTGSCNCGNGRNGRDPCTHQRTSAQKAPLASFFGGCCPPGRVLRRKPMARDVCIRKPKMNPFNPRALARADHRVTAFARRAAPMLRELGFQVATGHRKPKGLKKRRRR